MSKIKLKFDNRLDGNIIIAVYPKPENYKSVVLKAIESEQKIPAVNEVFDLEKSIDLFLQEFPELEGIQELFQSQEVSKANIIIDRINSNVTIKGNSKDGEIDLIQPIEYADNSGTYTISEGTEVEFSVTKQNVITPTTYFYTILDVEEVDVNGTVKKVSFTNEIKVSDRIKSVTEGNYYIQQESLLIRVEIVYIEIEGKKILTVKNHEILNGGVSYKIGSFSVRINDGYSEQIVEEILTNGTWSIPSVELIEGFYYNISFSSKGYYFSGTFERIYNKFKYLERTKSVDDSDDTSKIDIGNDFIIDFPGEVRPISEIVRPAKFLMKNIVLIQNSFIDGDIPKR